MKSLIKFLNESSNKMLKESSISDNCIVKFVKYRNDAGIMFEGEDGEYAPEDVEEICAAAGLDYEDLQNEEEFNVPVYFWNLTRNVGMWVDRGLCKDLL